MYELKVRLRYYFTKLRGINRQEKLMSKQMFDEKSKLGFTWFSITHFNCM